MERWVELSQCQARLILTRVNISRMIDGLKVRKFVLVTCNKFQLYVVCTCV